MKRTPHLAGLTADVIQRIGADWLAGRATAYAAADALDVPVSTLMRRLRRAGFRLSPEQRRAMKAHGGRSRARQMARGDIGRTAFVASIAAAEAVWARLPRDAFEDADVPPDLGRVPALPTHVPSGCSLMLDIGSGCRRVGRNR